MKNGQCKSFPAAGRGKGQNETGDFSRESCTNRQRDRQFLPNFSERGNLGTHFASKAPSGDAFLHLPLRINSLCCPVIESLPGRLPLSSICPFRRSSIRLTNSLQTDFINRWQPDFYLSHVSFFGPVLGLLVCRMPRFRPDLNQGIIIAWCRHLICSANATPDGVTLVGIVVPNLDPMER